MRVPRSQHRLAHTLECKPEGVGAAALQAHVVKHPFGMGALLGARPGERRWNEEGWDSLAPAVITLKQRREIVKAIRALEVGGATCAMPRFEKETYGGEGVRNSEPCYECPRGLRRDCSGETMAVAEAYLRHVDDALRPLADEHGVEVPRPELWGRLSAAVRSPDRLQGVVVLSTGARLLSDGRFRRFGRLSAWNGVRTEFYLNATSLTWRTTYRCPPTFVPDQVSLLLEHLPTLPGVPVPLSGNVLVPRRWWERN